MKRMALGIFLIASMTTAALPAAAQTEKLGNGDAVRVTVFQQPDLTTEARISERGTINMPLLGEVKLAGMSQSEAAGAIADGLKKGNYLKNPQVAIAITTLRSRQVSVLGLVARPGRYALDDTSSNVADVVAAAGGITAGGDNHVAVLRDGKTHRVNVLGEPFALKAGDTVSVDRAPVFYIYGEVARAGAYRIEPGMTVMQAIAAGGGMTPRGSEWRLKMRRNEQGKLVESSAKLQDRVRADDVIIVKEALF